MVIRHYRPRIASIVTKISSIIGWVGVISASVIWGILYWSVFAAATPLLYACSFILPFLGFSLAYVFARLMCRVISHAWPPVGILIGMAGQFIILPACGAALAWAFKLTPYEAMGVLMVSSCPGGSFSNFFTYWVDGDLALRSV
ncbi:hypothetical protein HAZT_HAZT011427, partial [Hyalella azteca]